MADYFPVISRAIAGLDPNTGETRRAVYERARAAIVRQLRAIEPPVPEDEIARQRANLEEAISKVEAEQAPRDATKAAAATPPKPAETAAPASPSKQPDPKPEPSPAAKGGSPARDKVAPSGALLGGSAGGKPSEAGSPGNKPSEAKPAEGRPSEAKPSEARPSATPRSATRPDGRPIVGTPASARRGGAAKRSTPVVALAAVAVIAVGGSLFAARSHIAALFSGGGTETAAPSDSGKPADRATAPSNGEGKSDDRLPQDDAAAPTSPGTDKPADGAGAPRQDRQAAAAPTQQPAEPAQPGPLVAQRAVLYEEGPNQQSGEALAGTVLWRTESVSGGPNQPLETALKGDIDIPGRNVKAMLTIRRNIDATLPASHTIEIQFTLPSDFPNAGVSNVPGLLMKADEAARGAAVAGLSVRVTNGFFLIGLSNLDSDRTVNEQLLKDRGWIDIPILYENGRRAVLTLEKGTPGTQAFSQAFDAWKSAAPTAANPPR